MGSGSLEWILTSHRVAGTSMTELLQQATALYIVHGDNDGGIRVLVPLRATLSLVNMLVGSEASPLPMLRRS